VSKEKLQGRDAIELLFEDNTDHPFSIHIETKQSDRITPEFEQGGGVVVTVWTRAGQRLRLPAEYRVVDTLPKVSL